MSASMGTPTLQREWKIGGGTLVWNETKVGGRREDRTRDLRIANAALSQLS